MSHCLFNYCSSFTKLVWRKLSIERQHGQMLPLDSLQVDANVKYAFFIINTSDLAYAMFEIGHFVGKLR